MLFPEKQGGGGSNYMPLDLKDTVVLTFPIFNQEPSWRAQTSFSLLVFLSFLTWGMHLFIFVIVRGEVT